jgi:hypothetical protein
MYDRQQNNNNSAIEDPAGIVRKLSSLNNIFRELKMLKDSEDCYKIMHALSKI